MRQVLAWSMKLGVCIVPDVVLTWVTLIYQCHEQLMTIKFGLVLCVTKLLSIVSADCFSRM